MSMIIVLIYYLYVFLNCFPTPSTWINSNSITPGAEADGTVILCTCACVCSHKGWNHGPSTTDNSPQHSLSRLPFTCCIWQQVLPAMPSKLHPAHLHHHLRHRLLSRITPTSRSPVCPISHRTKSLQFRPFRIWRYPSAPTHRALFSPFSHPVATHGSVFRTQLPHTGIPVCTLPGLVMGVERQSTLRSDSEGCVRCSDAAQ